ncbi:hypothetical protein [Sanguibacter sp. 25GB23B1]|uniref:hypothetical protein n=1 Tax=unclassified Sanguibacter TaxID=2645534 RepID=UPI0032AFEFD6
MKRSARILGLGLALLFFSLMVGGALAYVHLTDAFPEVVDRRMLVMIGFGVVVLLVVAVASICVGIVRAAAAIDRIADETQVFGRWTRLAGSEFPASALKNARQTAKRGAETSGARQRHARPATSAVPTVRTPTAAVSRVEAARADTAHLDSRSELDEHQRKLVAQYRAERGR